MRTSLDEPFECMHACFIMHVNEHCVSLNLWHACLASMLYQVCRVSRRCHAWGVALRTTTRCLSHYRRLWGKKRWLRWKNAQCIAVICWLGQIIFAHAWSKKNRKHFFWCPKSSRFPKNVGKKNEQKKSIQTKVQVYIHTPVISVGLVYLPTWMVDCFGTAKVGKIG